MGPKRLIRVALCVGLAAVGALVMGCGRPNERARAATPEPRPRHLQIVHAMTTPARRALVDRLKERNPATDGAPWAVNEEALTMSLTVVDPFTGFVRRARRERHAEPAGRSPVLALLSEDRAVEAAHAFVKRNADLLGLPRHVVAGLAEHVRSVEVGDHASVRAAYAIRFDAPFATKGYEGFKEVDNLVDLEVFVDDDGEVSSFVNLSRIHPRLTLDTRPTRQEGDPILVAKLVGRTVFAFVDDAAHARDELEDAAPRGHAAPRDLRRVPLGQIRADEVTQMQLVVHVATGPRLAWLTYRLAYFVEVAKPTPPELDDGPAPPKYFFFRYVVDADTGDVLEDARAPVSSPGAELP